MIRKLRSRFVRMAVLVLTAAMVLVVGIVNTANFLAVRSELGGTVQALAENNAPPAPPEGEDQRKDPEQAPESKTSRGSSGTETGRSGETRESALDWGWLRGRSRHFRNLVSESGWFSVYFSEDSTAKIRALGEIPDLDEDGAKKLAAQALSSGRDAGWVQDYCFAVRKMETGGRTVVLMNCETRMEAVRNLARISAAACAGGILIAWLLMRIFSRKAVDPTIRNMEQQKQFITNASHELKTPLTVISTNMELLNMETPDNQWVRSTQKQTASMRRLVDELVYLSRMEEENPSLNLESLSPGAMLREAAEPFQAMAEFGGKEMEVIVDDALRIMGDRASIQRLMSTLCDNAVKYTPEGGRITAEAAEEGRHAVIRVSNTVETPLSKEQCAQLFNRFYRADASRSREKGGFGIGLAIAAAIAEKHGGTMEARMEGDRLVISAVLPRDHKPEKPGITLAM